MSKSKILAIVGATGSGKSALALRLAERLKGEIVSCDSMQIYRRMDIGTAKPTAAERERVRHHLIDVVEPDMPFSCADYVPLAAEAIAGCEKRGMLPIVCGGTGLYLDALLRKNDFEPNTSDASVRAELTARAAREGGQALWEELSRIDPESARATHPNNVKRVLRALEIYLVSGVPKSEWDRRSREGGLRYEACVIGLRYPERQRLYERIDRRVDQMLREGLVEETLGLFREGVFDKNHTAAQAIGYKELLPYCRGETDLTSAAEQLKMATRRYAKRQMTWFGAKAYVTWLDVSADSVENEKTFEEIVNNAAELFQKTKNVIKYKGIDCLRRAERNEKHEGKGIV
ncbi:MAG: tRNA (adenosine(37)-N6)-dimethylallyltransferase MiaA [Clostridia bacterium]|nr:tRNA (adenosine(37)-N6)-dimethylallyltransferase MiaA [Clostridia bacterium]